MDDKETLDKLIDYLYTYYEGEHSLHSIRHIHPMFYNGTFSKDNSCQPPKPEPLMTKDEFIEKLNTEPEDYRWSTALQVLFNYKQTNSNL